MDSLLNKFPSNVNVVQNRNDHKFDKSRTYKQRQKDKEHVRNLLCVVGMDLCGDIGRWLILDSTGLPMTNEILSRFKDVHVDVPNWRSKELIKKSASVLSSLDALRFTIYGATVHDFLCFNTIFVYRVIWLDFCGVVCDNVMLSLYNSFNCLDKSSNSCILAVTNVHQRDKEQSSIIYRDLVDNLIDTRTEGIVKRLHQHCNENGWIIIHYIVFEGSFSMVTILFAVSYNRNVSQIQGYMNDLNGANKLERIVVADKNKKKRKLDFSDIIVELSSFPSK